MLNHKNQNQRRGEKEENEKEARNRMNTEEEEFKIELDKLVIKRFLIGEEIDCIICEQYKKKCETDEEKKIFEKLSLERTRNIKTLKHLLKEKVERGKK